MPRPRPEKEFVTFLEQEVRAIIKNEDATVSERLKAISEGRELLQIQMDIRAGATPGKKGMFGDDE